MINPRSFIVSVFVIVLLPCIIVVKVMLGVHFASRWMSSPFEGYIGVNGEGPGDIVIHS